MKNYIQVIITVEDVALKDQLIALLSLLEFDGFEELEKSLIAYTNEANYNPTDVDHICKELGLTYAENVVPQQNWNELWESNFEPVLVDDFCGIRADFHPPFTHTAHEIIITPKMSFGTGHHATTYLMIRQMSQFDFKNKTVADFGTGTGILAIMAAKLGAAKIFAIDNDDWSIENTKENISRNNCTAIEVSKHDYFASNEKFNIILANINKNVIIDNVDYLVNGLAAGGILLVSGLFKSDEEQVVNAFKSAGLQWKVTVERNNWILIHFVL